MAKYEALGNVPKGKVQRKFYITETLADLLRIEAAKRNESQSAIVERALKHELARNGRARNMAWTRAQIHYATNFDAGDLFRTEEQVREYFTVSNIADMFGSCPYTQEQLDEMAEEVIRHRWHMEG